MDIPELTRYLRRVPVENPDLSGMPLWFARRGLRVVRRDSVTLSRTCLRADQVPAQLSMRRWCEDPYHRLLAATDFDVPTAWSHITVEYTAPADSAYRYATCAVQRAGRLRRRTGASCLSRQNRG